MIAARRLRADPRQQPRSAVRPGAAVRHRRPAGRGLQGPRARAAAADHHAGAAHDGADPNLHGAAGRARPHARRPRTRSSSCWCASASSSSSSRGSRRSTSTRCSPPPSGCVALDARVVLHPAGHRPTTSCRSRPSARTHGSTSATWRARDGMRLTIRPIRPEDEPLIAPLPRDAVGRAASTCATCTRSR